MDSTTRVYNIFEFTSLDDVFIPVKNTARVKYTCFDVSKKFLFIGANSGSLYVFLRNPLQYLRVLSNKEGPPICIRIASHDQYVAFATSKGIVVLLEHNVNNVTRVGRSGTPTVPPRCLHVSREHQGAIITALTWNDSGTILFIADDSGKITSVTVNTPSKKTKTLFQESTAMIAQLDSKIVQMDFSHNKLLISTLVSCYLCDTLKEQYSQIGSKPRTGEFGACFYKKMENQMPCIYAARPGSRLWEVDFEGSVLCTHQFKQALAQKPVPIISVRENFLSGKTDSCPVPNSVTFPRLLIIGKRFLLTWVKDKLLLIAPVFEMVLLWTRFPKDIQDVRVHAKKLYVWFVDGRFRSYQLLTIDNGIAKLLSHSCWKLSAMVCDFYKAAVISASCRKLLPKHLLESLIAHLSQSDESELRKATEDLVASLEESPVASETTHANGGQFNYHVESGIYVVNRPRSDPKEISFHHECSSSGSSPAISRKTENGVIQSNGSATFENLTSNATGNNSYKVAKFGQESKCQNVFINSNEPLSKKARNFANGHIGTVKPVPKAIIKSASGTDMQHYKERKHGLSHETSIENVYSSYPSIPMPMSYIGGAFWDIDPTYGYASMATINPGAALDGLRNSLASKYNSGKESILGKIGVLEDHFKSLVIDDPQELLDVPNGNHYTSPQDGYSDLQTSYEEAICTDISQILKTDLSPLLSATKETLIAIHDSSAISSSPKQKQIIDGWVNLLISTQEDMYYTLYSQRNKAEQLMTSAKLIQCPNQNRCDDQSCSPDNDFRRKSWPNAACEKSNTCQKSNETELKESEPQKNINKSCPSEIGNIAICEQCCDISPNGVSPSLQLEDFFWWYDVKLLDENPFIQSAEASKGQCILCHPTIFTIDPWGLSLDEHKLISQLAAICYETSTFGRIWKYSADFDCFKSIANLESSGQAPETNEPLNFAANNNEMEKDKRVLDHARAIFVTQFFHLIDIRKIFKALHHEKCSTFKTWSAILHGVMKKVANGSSEFESFQPILSALSCQSHDFPVIVKQLLSGSEFCSARDVLYVDQLRRSDAGNLFLEYMDAVYERRSPSTTIQRGQVFTSHPLLNYQEICMDPIVHVAWFKHILQDCLQSTPEVINCVCGKPRPWAHLRHWKRKQLLLRVIRLNPATRTACWQLCEKFGFWLGYLYLCHGLKMRQEGLAILVQLGDLTLFGDHFDIALLPQTTDEWRSVLSLLARKENEKNRCLFCKEAITSHTGCENIPKENVLSFDSIAPFVLKFCDAGTALKLFKEIMENFPGIKISSTFYRQCILSAIVKQQEGRAAFNSLNACVLSNHKKYASPQIRSHLMKEVRNAQLETPESPAINRCPFREDFPCHWGINIDLSSLCCTCSLPLALPLASAHEGGLRMFPCGHGFHWQCITSTSCPLC